MLTLFVILGDVS